MAFWIVFVTSLTFLWRSVLAVPMATDLDKTWHETVLPQVSDSLTIDMSDKAAAASNLETWLEKRQGHILTRGLSVNMRVHCPEGGTFNRDVQWKVELNRETHKLSMDGIQYVTEIKDFKKVEPWDFEAKLRYAFCAGNHEKTCHYEFRAKTEGSSSPNSLTLSIVTDGPNAIDHPKWEEFCLPNTPMPGTCPVPVGAGTVACSMIQFVVSVLPPPEHPPTGN